MVTDLTRGNPMKVLLAFSMPMLIGNVVQQFYNIADLIIVGRFIGVNALASVGATSATMFFVFSLVVGLTNGAAVVVSQYRGYGDPNRVRCAVATSVYVLGIAGVFLTILGAVITRPVLTLLGTPPEILQGAVDYLQTLLYGVMATVAYNAAAAIIRALGDSVTPLVFLSISTALNVGLDFLFIVTFGMGLKGVAMATVIAQALAATACIVYAVRKLPALQLKKADFAYDRELFLQTIKLGIPGGIQNSLVSIGSMAVQSVVNSFGSQVVAAYAAATKLDQLAVQPLLSISMATATYTAQNVGAGLIDRVRKGFWAACGLCAIFCAGITTVLYLFGGNLMSLFVKSTETEVLSIGVEYLHIVSLFYIVLGIIIILESFLRGAGDVLVPMFSNAVEIVVRVGLAYILSRSLGHAGIWWCGPISWIAGTVVCSIRYYGGKWQYKSLISGGGREPLQDFKAEPSVSDIIKEDVQ